MPDKSRRDFLKKTAAIGAGITALSSPNAKAGPENILSPDRMGVLVDTTVCVGCRNCEWACKDAHGLPAGNLETYEDRKILETKRRPDHTALTVVNEYSHGKNSNLPVDVKVQCMHCDHPACVSACIVGAFSKHENGTVTWDSDMCIGCRYCMAACPFQIPAFEYDKALHPMIMKCDFCFDRTKEGKLPACVSICPVEALTYGTRTELVKIARDRIKRNPDRYVNHVFGEYEVGGTSWLYLASKDFVELDFPMLGKNPAPGVSESIQHGIFAYFVPPVSLYALLGGIMWITKRRKELEEEGKI
ncbi:MAG: 4Fe-4S dicluster domain-containing protein [Ignavibacteriaceae bacterium]|nr:4Fe-4S dicluster domain-containing protein [Ignavibacteriaceae bacterium]